MQCCQCRQSVDEGQCIVIGFEITHDPAFNNDLPIHCFIGVAMAFKRISPIMQPVKIDKRMQQLVFDTQCLDRNIFASFNELDLIFSQVSDGIYVAFGCNGNIVVICYKGILFISELTFLTHDTNIFLFDGSSTGSHILLTGIKKCFEVYIEIAHSHDSFDNINI